MNCNGCCSNKFWLFITEFIHLVSSEANEICNRQLKKTILPEHVFQALQVGCNKSYYSCTGLEITTSQQTMSGMIGELTGQPFVLPVMLTGHIRSY